MSQYPAYVVPSTAGITWAVGQGVQQQLPQGYTCTEAYAQIILKAFHDAGQTSATLVNAATEPGIAVFKGIDPADPNQPWWITGIPAGGPAGWAVKMMFGFNAINGGGVGNPGVWTGIGSNPKWAAAAPPLPPPAIPPPAVDTGGDAAAFGSVMGATDAAMAMAYAIETHRLVVAMAKAQGIS